jgi:hypothetical protein
MKIIARTETVQPTAMIYSENFRPSPSESVPHTT